MRAALGAALCALAISGLSAREASAQARVPTPEGISTDVLRGALDPAPRDSAPEVLASPGRARPVHRWLRGRGLAMGRRFRPSGFADLLARMEDEGPASLAHALRRYAAPRPPPMNAAAVPPSHQAGEQTSWLNAPALFEGVVVRARMDRQGRVTHAEVVRSSGSRVLDTLALAELRRDEPERAPPDELFGEDGELVCDWLFEMAHVGIPLAQNDPELGPNVTLPFGIVADLADLADGRAQPVVLGQGYVRTRVRALGVVRRPPSQAPAPSSTAERR